MKRIGCWIIGLMALHSFSLHAGALKFSVGEWEPYMSQTLPGYGCSIRVITRACELAGVECRYEFEESWKRSWLIAAKGESHGTFPWTNADQRDTQMFFCQTPVLMTNRALFYLKKDFPNGLNLSSYEELKKYDNIKPVAIRGYMDEELFAKGGTPAHIVNNEELVWKMMEKDRANLFSSPSAVAKHYMKQHSNLKMGTDVGETEPLDAVLYYLWYTRINEDVVKETQKVCDALAKMQEKNEIFTLTSDEACLEDDHR